MIAYQKRTLQHGILFLIVFIFFIPNSIFGQTTSTSFLSNTDWLEPGDKKKWDKLLEQTVEADELLNLSNDSYLRAGAIKADIDLDAKSKQKQIKKYEVLAIEQYVKALKLYRDVYADMHKLVNSYVTEEEKNHAAYSDFTYFEGEASSLYKEVGKASTPEQREKYSRANEMQLSSLEKGISMYTVPSEVFEKSTSETAGVAHTGDDIVIDNGLYQKYKQFIADSSISDPIDINQLMQLDGNAATFEAYKNLLRQYMSEEEFANAQREYNEQYVKDSLLEQQEVTNTQDAGGDVSANLMIDGSDNPAEGGNYSEFGEETGQTTNKLAQTQGSDQSIMPDGESKSSNYSQESGVSSQTALLESSGQLIQSALSVDYSSIAGADNKNEFRVQIAASRDRLSIAQLSAIYRGGLSVIEFKEGNYNKYQIRGFRLYTDAQAICSATGIDNAYLTAYRGASGVSLREAVKETHVLEKEVKQFGRARAMPYIEFSVQVAASRVRLTIEQVNNIYSGNYSVSTIFEEGWYKYQILTGNNFQDALNCLEVCKVNKAFIVAYKNGRKLKLYKALHEYKTYKP